MICDRIKYTSTDTLWDELTAPENVEYGKDFLGFRIFTNWCIYLSLAGYYALIFFQNAMGESVYDLLVIIQGDIPVLLRDFHACLLSDLCDFSL